MRWTRLLEVINGLCKTASGSGAPALLDCTLRGVVVSTSEDLLGLLHDVVLLAVCQALPLPCVLLGPLYFVPLLEILPLCLLFPLVPRSRTQPAHRIDTTEHRSAGHKTRAKERLGNAVNQIPKQHRNWMMTSVGFLKLQRGKTRNSHTSTCSRCQQVVL